MRIQLVIRFINTECLKTKNLEITKVTKNIKSNLEFYNRSNCQSRTKIRYSNFFLIPRTLFNFYVWV